MFDFFVNIVFCCIIFVVSAKQDNNACNNYLSYFKADGNPNCFYIPDDKAHVLEISRRHTGVGEVHDVTTEDGYILKVFRIPQKNPKDVVLLQHGGLFDARLWLAQYNESVALIFWKAGYDVWMGNFRGTLYGKKHLKLSRNQKAFWNFSFHEMGLYDLHATIEYIKKRTNRSQILYVGYGSAVSASFVYASLKPDDAKSIKAIAAISPFAYMNYTTSPIKYTVCPLANFLLKYNLDEALQWYSLPEYYSWYLKLVRGVAAVNPFKKTSAAILTFLGGGPMDQKDPRYMHIVADQSGSAASWKFYDHYFQILFHPDGTFLMYDYGKKKNLEIYGTEKAPPYPLKNVQIPVFSVHSDDDKSVFPKDVETLYSKLPAKAKAYGKKLVQGLGFFDYFWGKDRNEKVYKPILEFFENILSNQTANV